MRLLQNPKKVLAGFGLQKKEGQGGKAPAENIFGSIQPANGFGIDGKPLNAAWLENMYRGGEESRAKWDEEGLKKNSNGNWQGRAMTGVVLWSKPPRAEFQKKGLFDYGDI